jgi:hypothetical protein
VSLCRRVIASSSLVLGLASGAPARAQTAASPNERREELQDFYTKEARKEGSFFSGAPSHHITPKRDHISFSVQADVVDVGVAPASADPSADFDTLDNRLEMTGWSLFPLVSFAAKNFGVGFTGEAGDRQIQYVDRVKNDGTSVPGYFIEQFSEMKYTGIGLYVFATVRPGPAWLKATLIGGGRSLAAIEETAGTRTDASQIPDTTKLKYDVSSYDAGVNVAALLSKRFVVLPWVNYRKTFLSDIKDRNDSSNSAILTETLKDTVELDLSLTWLASPTVRYGVDFAVQLAKVEIHFGGVFGYLASLQRGADRIHDSSISAAVSYDMEGR